MLVSYVRDKRGEKVGCLVAVKVLENNKNYVGIGWSKCHRSDCFNKSVARFIAERRANKCLVSNGINECVNKIVDRYIVPACIKENVGIFVERARKYFKDIDWVC